MTVNFSVVRELYAVIEKTEILIDINNFAA